MSVRRFIGAPNADVVRKRKTGAIMQNNLASYGGGSMLRLPATRINDIVNEKRGITADTALRLARYFGTTPRFWMNMQASYELEVAEDHLGKAAAREVLPRTAA